VTRYSDFLTYYEGRLTRNADGMLTAAIYRVTGGVAKLLVSRRLTAPAAGVLRFGVEGSTLRLSYYDKVLTVKDTAFTGAGLAGVTLGAGAAADDFAVV
jgi:hypothetical protein